MIPQTMQAAVFVDEGNLQIREVDVPKIEKEDQLLVKVEAVSICGTDVHIMAVPPVFSANKNTILGHEFVGTVISKGDAIKHLDLGDHVVVNPNDYCGMCVYCRMNLPNHCVNRIGLGIDINGAFAEYCRVTGKVAYKINKDLPVELAAFAEPLACAINGLRKMTLLPGETIAVIGCGPIGIMMAMLAKANGARKVFLADRAPYRLDFVRQLDLGEVIDTRSVSIKDIIYSKTFDGVDIVADMVGSQLSLAIELVRKNGKVIVFGLDTRAKVDFPQILLTSKEVQVLGSWLANASFAEAVRVLESGLIDVRSLITDVIPLSDIHSGIKKLAKGEAIKILVKP
jgi:L-iditol 2-dehydrogenase